MRERGGRQVLMRVAQDAHGDVNPSLARPLPLLIPMQLWMKNMFFGVFTSNG